MIAAARRRTRLAAGGDRYLLATDLSAARGRKLAVNGHPCLHGHIGLGGSVAATITRHGWRPVMRSMDFDVAVRGLVGRHE